MTTTDFSAEMTSVSALSDAALGPTWQEQDPLLRELWERKLSPAAIGEKLGRSVAAIMTRAARLGLPRRAAPGRKPGRHQLERLTKKTRLSSRVPRPAQSAVPLVEQEAQRICLMCLKKFPSQGRHNRICPGCKGTAEYSAGSSIPDISLGA